MMMVNTHRPAALSSRTMSIKTQSVGAPGPDLSADTSDSFRERADVLFLFFSRYANYCLIPKQDPVPFHLLVVLPILDVCVDDRQAIIRRSRTLHIAHFPERDDIPSPVSSSFFNVICPLIPYPQPGKVGPAMNRKMYAMYIAQAINMIVI